MPDYDLKRFIKVYEEQLSEATCKDIISCFETSGKHHFGSHLTFAGAEGMVEE